MFRGTITTIEAWGDAFGNGTIGGFALEGLLHVPDRARPFRFDFQTWWGDTGSDVVRNEELTFREPKLLDLLSAREFLAIRQHLFDYCWAFDEGDNRTADLDLPTPVAFVVTDEAIAAVGEAA